MGTQFDLSVNLPKKQLLIRKIKLRLLGVHNILNATATFAVGFTSAADGKIRVSYGATQTGALTEGRYVYNVLISTGSTVYNIINGNVYVYAGISSSPGSV